MDYIKIGTIVKAQGIKGEVKVAPLTDDISRFLILKNAYIKQNGAMTPVRVMGARVDGKAAYLLLEKVYDRNAAELLRGSELYVNRENAVPLPEGRYFIVDLIGCRVEDEQGGLIGTLTDVLKPGANDVFAVDTENGELLIPVVDAFVTDINPEKRRITVKAEMLAQEEIRDN